MSIYRLIPKRLNLPFIGPKIFYMFSRRESSVDLSWDDLCWHWSLSIVWGGLVLTSLSEKTSIEEEKCLTEFQVLKGGGGSIFWPFSVTWGGRGSNSVFKVSATFFTWSIRDDVNWKKFQINAVYGRMYNLYIFSYWNDSNSQLIAIHGINWAKKVILLFLCGPAALHPPPLPILVAHWFSLDDL